MPAIWQIHLPVSIKKACTYVYTDDWSRNRWDHFYNDRTANEYAQIIKVCHFVNKDKYWNEFYVTRIYYAFLISMQTDTYGDIPLSYYIKGMLPPDTVYFIYQPKGCVRCYVQTAG